MKKTINLTLILILTTLTLSNKLITHPTIAMEDPSSTPSKENLINLSSNHIFSNIDESNISTTNNRAILQIYEKAKHEMNKIETYASTNELPKDKIQLIDDLKRSFIEIEDVTKIYKDNLTIFNMDTCHKIITNWKKKLITIQEQIAKSKKDCKKPIEYLNKLIDLSKNKSDIIYAQKLKTKLINSILCNEKTDETIVLINELKNNQENLNPLIPTLKWSIEELNKIVNSYKILIAEIKMILQNANFTELTESKYEDLLKSYRHTYTRSYVAIKFLINKLKEMLFQNPPIYSPQALRNGIDLLIKEQTTKIYKNLETLKLTKKFCKLSDNIVKLHNIVKYINYTKSILNYYSNNLKDENFKKEFKDLIEKLENKVPPKDNSIENILKTAYELFKNYKELLNKTNTSYDKLIKQTDDHLIIIKNKIETLEKEPGSELVNIINKVKQMDQKIIDHIRKNMNNLKNALSNKNIFNIDKLKFNKNDNKIIKKIANAYNIFEELELCNDYEINLFKNKANKIIKENDPIDYELILCDCEVFRQIVRAHKISYLNCINEIYDLILKSNNSYFKDISNALDDTNPFKKETKTNNKIDDNSSIDNVMAFINNDDDINKKSTKNNRKNKKNKNKKNNANTSKTTTNNNINKIMEQNSKDSTMIENANLLNENDENNDQIKDDGIEEFKKNISTFIKNNDKKEPKIKLNANSEKKIISWFETDL